MNETTPAFNNIDKKRLGFYSTLMFGAFSIYVVFVCLSNIISSNILFSGMMLLEITELVYQTIEILAFFFAYAYVIYAIYMGGYRYALRFAIVYAVAISARYVILFALDWIFFGLKTEDVPVSLLFVLINVLLELLQYVLVGAIAQINVNAFNKKVAIMQKGAARLKDTSIVRERLIFPYQKMPIKNDPLRFSALLTALLMGAIRVIGRISYDIGYGAPADLSDVLWMILYYTFDILIGVACYFVLLFIVRKLILSKEN
ncbi:MAG: hypothetical protein IKC97_08200 [Clostridia bacterium]|nr:hypothetical protein [Clostridia bacterium]